MWNPFKHEQEHAGIEAWASELTWALDNLRKSVEELREEIDYIADFLGLDD
jgi:hypothetical protein